MNKEYLRVIFFPQAENIKIYFLHCFFQESISTCRFAQRVSLIKNEAILNEELDPALVRAPDTHITSPVPTNTIA